MVGWPATAAEVRQANEVARRRVDTFCGSGSGNCRCYLCFAYSAAGVDGDSGSGSGRASPQLRLIN